MLRRRNWSTRPVSRSSERARGRRGPLLAAALCVLLVTLPPQIVQAEENGFSKLWIQLKSAFKSPAASGEEPEDAPQPEASVEPVEGAAEPPATKKPRSRSSQEMASVQRDLKRLGYDPGPLDGISGPRTRSAIRAYREDHGLEPGTRVDGTLLVSLRENAVSERTTDRAPQTGASAPAQGAPAEHRALSAKARGFEFRGMRLGDSLARIRSIFPEARISSDERVYRGRSVVESYFGIVEEQGLSLRFSRGKRLYRLNSAQLIDRPLSAAAVRAKFVKKYGEPDFEEALNEDGSAVRLSWGLREGSGGAGMQVTVRSPAGKNVTRINTRLWDDAAARRNLAEWSSAIKRDHDLPPEAEEVNL